MGAFSHCLEFHRSQLQNVTTDACKRGSIGADRAMEAACYYSSLALRCHLRELPAPLKSAAAGATAAIYQPNGGGMSQGLRSREGRDASRPIQNQGHGPKSGSSGAALTRLSPSLGTASFVFSRWPFSCLSCGCCGGHRPARLWLHHSPAF